MANSEGPVFLAGEKTVAVAGTAEPLVATSQRVKSLVVIAKKANLNQVYLGGADVASTTNDGLDAAETITIEAVRPGSIWPTFFWTLTPMERE